MDRHFSVYITTCSRNNKKTDTQQNAKYAICAAMKRKNQTCQRWSFAFTRAHTRMHAMPTEYNFRFRRNATFCCTNAECITIYACVTHNCGAAERNDCPSLLFIAITYAKRGKGKTHEYELTFFQVITGKRLRNQRQVEGMKKMVIKWFLCTAKWNGFDIKMNVVQRYVPIAWNCVWVSRANRRMKEW